MLKYETENGKTIMVICGQKVTEEEAKKRLTSISSSREISSKPVKGIF